ncbi:putative NRPS-like protein biosynthetic cluster [Pyricularia oryzae]|uniref:NRPS-like protein biosynthetic cluster n=2 Tax=Pyricularia TaxID=48558 RepID=A0ABQ8NY32_PYRGI|nr:putative NRPS-like protein biosynthetic cluster [Pyricularia oryzae]KAI6303799.1 putative NRPS-like protein biosynthetic cluster [Pyricularia grisea]KAH9437426.1 hypothetical protein MCOR02_001083 [Pyricularia oryzae]KAI6259459.1 putative NRPS-like protein biosynthetic cluster [Pyricularia oryzae]KAI6280470.1 putative NRPS-like protein biosynthetic cluster [Pyricularia oryzae]
MESMSTDLVAYHARANPKALAAVEIATARCWSYRQLHDDINKACAVLAAHGVQKGDRVAVLAANSVFVVILQQALMRQGAIIVPLNWRLSASEIGSLIEDCSPKLLFWDATLSLAWPDFEPHFPALCQRLPFQDFITRLDQSTLPTSPVQQQNACTTTRLPNATAAIVYTSGTSGRPKGVKITAHNLLATAINYAVLGEVEPTSVLLCDVPLFHLMGLAVCVWSTLLRGGTVAMSRRFDASATNERLSAAPAGLGGRMVTHYFCVPQMADALRSAPNFRPARWAALRALFTGGAPNPPARIRWWLDRGVRMVNGYGATEAGHFFGMPLAEDVLRQKAGSVGLAGPMTDVEIVDPETGAPVLPGEPGEIVASGTSVTAGYWGRADRDGGLEVLEHGAGVRWYRTGDIGRQDEDGFVYIVGRRKDIFITGGESVAPGEVETALMQHPLVAEAAVVGVPDPTWGEVGYAWLVLEQGVEERVSKEDLISHCEGLIGRYKIPKHFRNTESLPRTGSGKIMKHVLKKKLESEGFGREKEH